MPRSISNISAGTSSKNAARTQSSQTLQPKGSYSRRNVQFSTVEVRYYNRVLGDNPACSMGPPIAIGWEYQKELAMSIDQYEVERCPSKSSCRFALTPSSRRNILHINWGYTNPEMDKVNEEIEAIRKSRARSECASTLSEKRRHIEKLEKAHKSFHRVKKVCHNASAKSEMATLFQSFSNAKRKVMRKGAGGSLKISRIICKTNKHMSHIALRYMRCPNIR